MPYFALSLVAAACGSDDDDSSDSGTVTDDTEAGAPDTAAEGAEGSPPPAGDGVRLGIMAECEGAFGGFDEDVVGRSDARVDGTRRERR